MCEIRFRKEEVSLGKCVVAALGLELGQTALLSSERHEALAKTLKPLAKRVMSFPSKLKGLPQTAQPKSVIGEGCCFA